jgi:Leucine-rich repeat (LRR) protein
VLDVSFNTLRALPADIGACLPALRQLYAACNALTDLPDSLDRVRRRRSCIDALPLCSSWEGQRQPS